MEIATDEGGGGCAQLVGGPCDGRLHPLDSDTVELQVIMEDGHQHLYRRTIFRACRAVVVGAGGRLSGPFERLEPDHRAVALEHMLALPDNVGLPEPRHIVPVMVEVQRRHPVLNVLNTEAVAAALLLGAKMVLSPPTAQGQLQAVLPDEGIAFQTVDLP